MRVLVTGATGFTGWHATASLLRTGARVRALVRDADKAERLLGPDGPLGAGALSRDDFVVGDMTDPVAVADALDGVDAVVHAAATVSVRTSAGVGAFDGNVTGTELVVGGAADRGIERIVFVSSTAAIFDPFSELPTTADSPPVRAGTRYGRSKVAAEKFVRVLQERGAPITTVYPSGVIGPDDPGLSESVRAYRSFLRGTLRSSGGTQFVDARDLGHLLARLVGSGTGGRLIAAGPFFDWDELTALIDEVCGTEIRRISAPGWLLRGAGRVVDLVGRASSKEMPVSGEGIAIATLWRPIADSPELAELGVSWRPPEDTLRDMFTWFLWSGRLPAAAVPALAVGTANGDSID